MEWKFVIFLVASNIITILIYWGERRRKKVTLINPIVRDQMSLLAKAMKVKDEPDEIFAQTVAFCQMIVNCKERGYEIVGRNTKTEAEIPIDFI